MPAPRRFALVRTADQWLRSGHVDTALDTKTGVVGLAWTEPPSSNAGGDAPPRGAGLAFDQQCRLYHSVPDEGRVEWSLWAGQTPRAAGDEPPAPLDLFAAEVPPAGEFTPVTTPTSALSAPRGLAVDHDDRLFIAETGAGRLLIFDLWGRRLLRRVVVAAPDGTAARPLDLAAHGTTVYALLAPAGLVELTARSEPRALPLPADVTEPARLAVAPGGRIVLLERAGSPLARIVPLDRPGLAFVEPHATDIEFEDDEVLVVARRPAADFRRYRLSPGAPSALLPLKASGYDGLGIVRTPDGRIGFWTGRRFRHAVAARVVYDATGRITTFRLDSGEFQTVWGRLFIDACIPEGTDVRVHCLTLDEPPDEGTVPLTPPRNVAADVARPDLSPPLPPLSLAPGVDDVRHPLHRRQNGRELPWMPMAADDPFVTYEAPVLAPPGRYLWVTLELHGQTHVTPRVRCLRAEYPSHDYLRRLPKTFSREPAVADFLRRYLAMFEGPLGELEARAAERHRLLNPWSAPDEALPWLASFLGLVLDERWSGHVRRALIDQAVWLFRRRGTVLGLMRFLELYLGTSVIVVEHFRLRGFGGALLGESGPAFSHAVVGAGFRVGGALGEPTAAPLTGSVEDAFETHAHRFTVVIPALLTGEQEGAVRHILETHRPAHTLFEICTVDAGMRVGQGLHVGLSSLIGRTGGFTPLRVGGAALGREAVVGRPDAGTRPGSSRVGGDSRVG